MEVGRMDNILDKLEGTDTVEEKPMTNQEYVNDYLAKCLGMLKAREQCGNYMTEDDKETIGNIRLYLDKKEYSEEYEYSDTSKFSHVQNQMQLKYRDWYDKKNDSDFIDTIIKEIGIKTGTDSKIFETGCGLFYTHEIIKVLADIASSEKGFNKIVDALKVIFEKSKDIMPNPYMGYQSFVREVKKIDETLDGIVEYGRKHGILEKEE